MKSTRRPPARRVRAPEDTRARLLAAAFDEMHRHGYQGAALDRILGAAGVTKGALYHHFADKADLARAVVEEVVGGLTADRWVAPVTDPAVDPIDAIRGALRAVADAFCDARAAELVELGCPLNNLAQEMSPLDERFRRRVAVLLEGWVEAFARALERGRAAGTVRRDVEARKVAAFVVASIEGSFGLAKSAKSAPLLRANLEVLAGYLDTLRAAGGSTPAA